MDVLPSTYISIVHSVSLKTKLFQSPLQVPPFPWHSRLQASLFSLTSCRTITCTIHLVLILQVLWENRTYRTRYSQNPDVSLNRILSKIKRSSRWNKPQRKNFRHHDKPWKRFLWHEILLSTLTRGYPILSPIFKDSSGPVSYLFFYLFNKYSLSTAMYNTTKEVISKLQSLGSEWDKLLGLITLA